MPRPVQKMARHIDTTEVSRGPDDLPGYWVVTGAKLCMEGGKVALKVKYSLLIAVQEDPEGHYALRPPLPSSTPQLCLSVVLPRCKVQLWATTLYRIQCAQRLMFFSLFT